MTQKEIRTQISNLWVEVNQLESKIGFLPPTVDPDQAQWITDIEEQVIKVKSKIDSLMRQLEV